MARRWMICLVAIIASACHDAPFGDPEAVEPTPPTTTIALLRTQFSGDTFPINGDIAIEGVVTSSDRRRNFYRTLCIEHNGSALELMAGVDHLHNDFPVGCRVTLRLRGLALGMSFGVLQVGRMPAPGSGYPTDYIASPAALFVALMRHEEVITTITPQRITYSDLRPEMAGRLLRLDRLHYSPEELSPSTWSGYKRFTDDAGNEIYTYVRTYANFAMQEIPIGECSMVGILQWDKAGDGRYIIKLRDEDDCIY